MDLIEKYMDPIILNEYSKKYRIDKRNRETLAYGRLIYFTTLERVFDNLTDEDRLVIINSELERYQNEAIKIKQEKEKRLNDLEQLPLEQKQVPVFIDTPSDFDYKSASKEEKRKNLKVLSHYDLAKQQIESSYMYEEEISFLKGYLEQIQKKQVKI